MKIIVVSDTHRDYECLRKLRQLHNDANMFLHLGDSELPSYMLDGFASVKGNCDYFEDYPENKIVKTLYGNIYMEHGHRYTLTDNYIKSKNCIIFLSGHTHAHSLRKIGDCYAANPGSLIKPRDNTNGTYLIIELEDGKVEFIFKELF